ncbi:MAG: 50S ribosomal protein L10 [Alphaproteobacteria bacterium]|nr:50S ribosomal protein L10 [Alphaproteobacteria bacterium]
MAITKQKKEAIVARVKKAIQHANTIVFVSFDKITANEANAMRDTFFDSGVEYIVAKKTLIAKAFEGSSFSGEFPTLPGEVALACGKDMLAPAQLIASSAKELKNNRLVIVGGIFEGAFVPKEKMIAIGNIPALKTLHTQFVSMLNSPLQGFVSVLHQVATKKQ